MKQLLLLLLVVFATNLQAKNYYVSATGNDASDGLTTATPWKSIAKVNSFTFAANDYILFKRGDIFYGSLKVTRSTLFFSTYGTGENPIISGLSTVASWTNLGSNIWESNVLAAKSSVDIVTVNGQQVAPGRYPNSGYLTYQSSTTTSYNASALPSSPSFTGGECVARKERWIMDRQSISSHSGTTLNVATSTSGYPGKNNAGLFIQKHINTLDIQGEWVFTASTGKLKMYSTASPALTKICIQDTLFNIGSYSNITIDGLAFEGAGYAAILSTNSNTVNINNCIIRNAGQFGIHINNTPNITIDKNKIFDVLGIAIYVSNTIVTGSTVTNNNINRSGWIAGLGWKSGGASDDSYSGLSVSGNGTTIQYNTIDSIGYKGINFTGSNVLVANNFVSNYCMVKDDGGGIYTWSNNGSTTYTNRVVRDNIVLNSIGAPNGTHSNGTESHGIYMDGAAMAVDIYGNSIINGSPGDAGIFFNNTSNIRVRSNTFYNVSTGMHFNRLPADIDLVKTMTVTGNIVYPNTSNFFYWNGSLHVPSIVSIEQDMRNMFTRIDSNYYRSDISSPFDWFYHQTNGGTFVDPASQNLSNWKTTIGGELNSSNISTSPKNIQFNATSSPTTYSFAGYSKKDVYGKVYNNSVTIPAWSSIILIENGTASAINIAPAANAGTDKIITLPTNVASLNGSGTDADGTISNFSWVKISGPVTGTIGTPDAATTAVNNLGQGLYKYELSVTDNSGAIGKDTVQVTVNAASNLAPTANAGTNKIITLPINSTSLTGTATDADGTISSYAWVKISGPASGTIASPNAAITNLNNLVQGNYQIELTVTDNNGAIGKDTAQVTVNALSNVAPTANAGTNKIITLPINSTSLTGTAIDADGTISSYAWVKISGPASGTIASPNAAITAVNNLGLGIYLYELTVTDNNGAIGKDTVQVTVNAAFNLAPTANAGTDIIITLPTNSASLNGTATDADGTISKFEWVKISGPASGTIESPNAAATAVNNLIQGIYHYQLTVTDNNGTVGKDTVQVTVNAASNQAPTANAGNKKSIKLPTNTTTLTGSGTDVDGIITSYTWTKISGPLLGSISTGNQAITEVTNLVQGIYQFELVVTDNNGAIGRDTAQVTVNAATNQAPVAKVGSSKKITETSNSITLSGSGEDVDGTISSYQWAKVSGPVSGTIVTANEAITEVNNLVSGIYEFELTVTDDNGATGKDTLQVTVNVSINQVPIANAGIDKTITLPGNTTSLNGIGIDADGTISNFAWLKISGPEKGNIASANKANTEINQLIQGIYQFELTVTDDKGAIGKDTVQVTVNAAPNLAPQANAGTDKTITLPINTITLNGDGTDTDGNISSYAWIKISGPEPGTIATANNANTTINNLVQGFYQFELTVTDNQGAIGKDTVKVFVNAPANEQPLANAGTDKTITIPVNYTTLSGTGTDTDGTISSYTWVKISGPVPGNIATINTATTEINNLIEGIYQFELTVTDNNSAIGRDTVQVTVNAAPNLAPMANAGTDKIITLPLNTISLNGGGTDLDGNISSYIWIKIAGPAAGEIKSMNASTTDVNYLIQGVYQFELTVTDNNGAPGKDTMQVTVNAATIINKVPVVNAGDDVNIVLPANSVSLKGIATDPDGTIMSYKWEVISGPTGHLFTSPNLSETKIENLFQGVYLIQFTALDNSGAETRDSLSITVSSPRLSNINSNSSPTNQFKVYPNPVKDVANININTINKNTQLSITVMNASGKLVTGKEFVTADNSTIYQLDMSNLSNGIYFITLRFDDGQILSTKVLKNGSN